MPLQPSERLGVYEIVDLLGEGGMGQVYRARDGRLQREVAIKVLTLEESRDRDALARFEREAQAVAALSHPNVLQIFDYGRDAERAWAVTELLEGETLRELLDRRSLDPGEVVDLSRQMLGGVAAAHAKGIVHRDLKPENVFVVRDETTGAAARHVKVLDFGLAKRTVSSLETAPDDATLGATMPGTVLGTVGYMAPEQVRGQEADTRSDVFALGVILYEMLSGGRAFSGPSAVETLSAILHETPRCEALPAELRTIVERCLAKEPTQRFASAAEVLAALSGAVAHPSSAVTVAPTPRASAKPPEADDADQRAVAVLPFANLSPDPDTEYFSDGVTDEIINALAQIRGLRVAARTSSFHFKGSSEDLQTIGAKLHVGKLVEGSVRRAGNRLRITAQLVNVADGYQLWSERFDREMDDIFAVQDEIAAAVAERLKGSLSGAPPRAAAERPRVDQGAYELLLRGRFLHEQRSLTEALECYERAREIDPEYAPIHTAIAQNLVLQGLMGRSAPRDVMPASLVAAERALEIDPNEVTAHTVIGMMKWLYEWNAVEAEAAFERALELGPNATDAHTFYAFFLSSGLGRFDEAVAHTEKAVELDPMSDFAGAYHGMVLFTAGRHDEGIEFLEPFLARERHSYLGWRMLGLCYLMAERWKDAEQAFETALGLSGRHTFCVVEMGLTRLGQGRPEEAAAFQAEAVERVQSYGTPAGYLAVLPQRLGDLESAREYLRRGVEARDAVVAVSNHWPTWHELRYDERFADLFAEMATGLPPSG